MKFSLNTKTGIAMLLLAAMIVVVACQKNETGSAPLLSLNNELASVSIAYTDTVFGNFANPSGGAIAYDTIYFNAITGVSDTAPFPGYNIVFYGFNNGIIARVDSLSELKYLNTTTALTSISSTSFSTPPSVVVPGGIGENTSSNAANNPPTANGWWNYNRTTREVESTKNFIFFYRPAGIGSSIYAFQVIEAWGEGVPTSNRGVYIVSGGLATP